MSAEFTCEPNPESMDAFEGLLEASGTSADLTQLAVSIGEESWLRQEGDWAAQDEASIADQMNPETLLTAIRDHLGADVEISKTFDVPLDARQTLTILAVMQGKEIPSVFEEEGVSIVGRLSGKTDSQDRITELTLTGSTTTPTGAFDAVTSFKVRGFGAYPIPDRPAGL